MTEKQRIVNMMKKHKAYFENVKGVDVAFSAKGEYFFYEHSEKYSDYPVFVKFMTAEELEQIIEENIATDFCVNLEEIAEEMVHVLDGSGRQEIDVTDISQDKSDLDRRTLVNAFMTFSRIIDDVHKKMQPFQEWVNTLVDLEDEKSV